MKSVPTIPIRYVGKKAEETDHLYGTGIAWTGKGDVQQVPIDKAPLLLAHEDVWEDARSAAVRKKQKLGEAKFIPERYREEDDPVPVAAQVHLMPLEDLTRYALVTFGERFSPEITLDAARTEVVRLMHTRG